MVAFEASVGLAILGPARWARGGLIAAIAFELALVPSLAWPYFLGNFALVAVQAPLLRHRFPRSALPGGRAGALSCRGHDRHRGPAGGRTAMSGAERFAAILALVVGVLILGLWAFLLATRNVREVARGERGMWFHIAPETITALLLLGGGASLLLTDAAWARLLAGVALGALLYTVVNSPGHYADLGQPGPVAMFGALAVVPQVASSPSSSREPGCGRGAATR